MIYHHGKCILFLVNTMVIFYLNQFLLPDDNIGTQSDSSQVTSDGRCTCCPYGYHVDLDFLKYCDSLSNGNYLRNLKKIERNKRKLRKSMEVFLSQQQKDEAISGPPPDVVNSTDSFMNMLDYEDSNSNHLLEEIDSSVNATLSSIDERKRYYNNSNYYAESEDDSSTYGYRTERELMLVPHQMNKSDSLSSLSSSHSTISSDFMANVPKGTSFCFHLFIFHPLGNISSRISGNSEADVSEFLKKY